MGEGHVNCFREVRSWSCVGKGVASNMVGDEVMLFDGVVGDFVCVLGAGVGTEDTASTFTSDVLSTGAGVGLPVSFMDGAKEVLNSTEFKVNSSLFG